MIAVTGANGVGKSTLAEKISKERGMKFICPDVPQGESRHEETLALAAQHIARRESYAHDDVFRKTKVEQSMLKAKKAGYWIEAHIVLVSGPGTSIERVNIRGEKGGHWHSEEYIRKHYKEALRTCRGKETPEGHVTPKAKPSDPETPKDPRRRVSPLKFLRRRPSRGGAALAAC